MNTGEFTTEKELLAQVASGREESFQHLFRIYHERVLNYVATFIKSPQIAEEVVMDVFLKIWLGKEMITQIDDFDSFLFRVAHNKSIDFLRSVSADPKFRDLLWDTIQLSGSDYADSVVLGREFETKVREAVSLLSQQRRKVYQLSREEDMSHEEIAYHLGLSKNTVNNHIVEAKRFIRSYLAQNLDIAFLLAIVAGIGLKK